MTFSLRVPSELTANRLANHLAAFQRQGREIIDLTLSNPTCAGFIYPDDLLVPLGRPRGLIYRPQPLGLPEALDAVSQDFARRGLSVPAERLALAASTSEGYALLFKLLCDPGDSVVIPRPSYPLFEHLTRLEGVTAATYELEYHGRWSINVDSLEDALTEKTRAIVIVSPNNPTGNFISASEVDAIASLGRDRNVAIISDEVFADYELMPGGRSGLFTARTDVLAFTLGGLSKSIGLPQAKLAWVAASGAAAQVDTALARFELICDTYLSVATPLQIALPELLHRGAVIRRQIHDRVRDNYQTLIPLVAKVPSCDLLRAEGGWYAVLRVPSLTSEEDLVLGLLEEDGVLTHPGYFFDFPTESFLVVSLLPRADAFLDGVGRLLRRFNR